MAKVPVNVWGDEESADRNQVRSPNIRFRVYSQNNGECKREFHIKLKDLTWDSFLKNLFGSRTFGERELPTIVLLGDKHKIVLRHANIKQLIRDALEESFKGFCVKLLIPDFENLNSTAPSSAAQNTPTEEDPEKMKAEINDFCEIFSKRINLPTMDQFVQTTPHVRFREDKDQATRAEAPARDKMPQLGELEVKRLNDGDLINLLRDGASLIMKTSDDKMVSLKFYNDQLPTFNETRCAYKNLDLAYECNYLKVPVVVDDDIKFLFKQDAEFIHKMSKSLEAAEKSHREHIIRLRKFHETMKKIKSARELSSTDPAVASTSGVTPATASTTPVESPAPPTNSPATKTPPEPAAPAAVLPTSEGSSNEGAQPAIGRAIRKAHRSAQRKNKRCVAATALANAALAGVGLSAVPHENSHPYPAYPKLPTFQTPLNADGLAHAMQNINLSPRYLVSSRHSEGLTRVTYDPSVGEYKYEPIPPVQAQKQSVELGKPKGQLAVSTNAIGEMLEKFKVEVMQDVKALVKDCLETSAPIPAPAPAPTPAPVPHGFGFPSTSNAMTNSLGHFFDTMVAMKAVDGLPSSADKHKHHGSGSSKKKSTSLGATTTQLSVAEKMVDVGNGFLVLSRNGFKVRMPRNTSLTLQLVVMKSSRCRIPVESTNLRLQLGGTSSIECCVTRVGAASPRVYPKDREYHPVHYDIRIKSKDKSGRYRLYFNITSGSAIIGRSFKIDVRVKKDLTMPVNGIDGTALKYDTDRLMPIRVVDCIEIQTTSSAPSVVESQNSTAPQPNEQGSAAAAELADEGIGGNQEDDFSPSSDSEYSDVQDMLLAKDEGIGRRYRSLVDEKPKEKSPDVAEAEAGADDQNDLDSESDTDSSISFLMDENEARDLLDDSLDVVQLPSCFIPNVELTDDVLPVRIKRKGTSSTKRSTTASAATETESGSDSQQSSSVKPSAFDSSPLTPVAAPAQAPAQLCDDFVIKFPGWDEATKARSPAPVENLPPVTISDDEEDEDVEFLAESIKTAAVDHAYHRSLYPNLQGLKESVRVTPDQATASQTFNPFMIPRPPRSVPASKSTPFKLPETSKASASTSTSTSPTNASTFPPILPEKLFEMFKNASVPKQMHNTMSSVLTSVSNEINNAANAARTAAASAAAAAATIVPNVPMPQSPTAPPAASENVTQEQAPQAAAAPEEARSAHSQPPEEKRSKNVSFSVGESSTTNPTFEFGRNENQNQNQNQNDMYKNLSEQMQADLITLHDMGFTDDPYMIYLLEQFPNDLSKVIESLINYSTY